MYTLVRPFIEICLLRLNPQDLPYSWLLLGLALLAHTCTGALASAMLLPPGQAVLAGITGSLLLVLLTAGLLYTQQCQARLVQTLTALAGSMSLLDLAALPITNWWDSLHAAGLDTSLPTLLLLVLTVWNLVVAAHVLRHALQVTFLLAAAASLAFYWAFFTVMNALFNFGP